MKIFGEWNNELISRGQEHAPTPVGALCTMCMEAIQDGDAGQLMPDPIHRECFKLHLVGHIGGGQWVCFRCFLLLFWPQRPPLK